MKTQNTFLRTAFVMFCAIAFLGVQVKATIHTVSVANNTFTPGTINFTVGDTVKWVWAAGNHTTTSITVPAGAATWDHPMASASDVFVYPVLVAGTYSYDCSIHGTMMSGGFTATAATTGMSQTTNESHFSVYPNPVMETLNVHLSGQSSGQYVFSVYDMLGREVMTRNVLLSSGQNDLLFDVIDLKKGIYFLKMTGAGKEARVIKISKE